MNKHQLFPYKEFYEIIGGENWAVARRTRRIVSHYGIDVICLSHKSYVEAVRLARLRQAERTPTAI